MQRSIALIPASQLNLTFMRDLFFSLAFFVLFDLRDNGDFPPWILICCLFSFNAPFIIWLLCSIGLSESKVMFRVAENVLRCIYFILFSTLLLERNIFERLRI